MKDRIVCVFRAHCVTALFKIKFHYLHHQCKGLDKFGSIIFLDASMYEKFTVLLNRA